MKQLLLILLTVLFFTNAETLRAQDYTSDTETIESTMSAILEVISGPAGREMDWARWRNLFRGDVPFFIRAKGRDGEMRVVETSSEGYVENIGPSLAERHFYETYANLRIDQYGDIAHVLMVYESKETPDAEPFDRGINSFQLMYDEGRWWIVGLMWQAESTGVPIPKKYLKKGKKKRG